MYNYGNSYDSWLLRQADEYMDSFAMVSQKL